MVKQLTDKNPDGTNLGQDSADKIAFYGATPIARPTGATAITTTQPTLGATAAYGFTTTAQFNNLIAAVNTILTNMGASKLNLQS